MRVGQAREMAGCVALAMALAACAASPTPKGPSHPAALAVSNLCGSAARPERLVVTRTAAFPENDIVFSFPAKVAVSAPSQLAAVDQAVCSLPPAPKGPVSCPAELGIDYSLAFSSPSAPRADFAAIHVGATDCEIVTGTGSGARTASGSPAFWDTLGRAMGLANPGDAAFRGKRGTPTSPRAVTAKPASVSVPVVACPTSQAFSGEPFSLGPSITSVTMSTELGSALAYYSGAARSMIPLLGPKGWHCSASVYGDTTMDLTLLAPNEPLPKPFTDNRAKSDEAVTANIASPCLGCVYGLVCPLIQVVVHTQLGRGFGPCPAEPRAETVTWLRGTPSQVAADRSFAVAVAFEDPPGTAGEGKPSGGLYPANGLLLFSGHDGGYSATLETCTLPAAEHATCTEILNQFLTAGWPVGSR
ncbi:MAG: hypothetical protein ACRDY2_03570 [Acidimicrobiales bacterium]